jgi:hypothetical protein
MDLHVVEVLDLVTNRKNGCFKSSRPGMTVAIDHPVNGSFLAPHEVADAVGITCIGANHLKRLEHGIVEFVGERQALRLQGTLRPFHFESPLGGPSAGVVPSQGVDRPSEDHGIGDEHKRSGCRDKRAVGQHESDDLVCGQHDGCCHRQAHSTRIGRHGKP